MARRRRLTPAQPDLTGPDSLAAAGEPRPALAALGSAQAGPPIAQVARDSAEAAALREVGEELRRARATGRMVVEVPLGEVSPGFLARDRIGFDAEEIAALKGSIRAHGQRTPAEITPLAPERDDEPRTPYTWGLISGWRRLKALSELHNETGEARFSTLRALVRPPEAAAASYVAMVEENEIRVGLSYYERARVVAEAAARGVFPDQSAALNTLFATASRAKRSKIRSFICIHEVLGDLLNHPAEISERLGLALVPRLKTSSRVWIRAVLAEARPADAKAEVKLLEQVVRSPDVPVSRAKQERETLTPSLSLGAVRKGQRLTLTLTGPEVNDALLARVRQVLRDAF